MARLCMLHEFSSQWGVIRQVIHVKTHLLTSETNPRFVAPCNCGANETPIAEVSTVPSRCPVCVCEIYEHEVLLRIMI